MYMKQMQQMKYVQRRQDVGWSGFRKKLFVVTELRYNRIFTDIRGLSLTRSALGALIF